MGGVRWSGEAESVETNTEQCMEREGQLVFSYKACGYNAEEGARNP